MRTGKRGFSLLELLVVVVIISVISFLGFPAMQDTISEGRLYSSARAVAQTLLYARMQAIMRNQAHEVVVTTEAGRPGGTVEVRRAQSTDCTALIQRVSREADLDQEVVGISGVLNGALDGDQWRVCFRPNGRAYQGGAPLAGEPHIRLERYTLGDAIAPVGWPLFVRVGHMGMAQVAKTPPSDNPGAGDELEGQE